MREIFLKRIYEPFDEMDGSRILIDRVWPRGMSKEAAKLTHWFKDISPSPELRKWFCHKPELFDEFRSKYIDELRTDEKKLQLIEQIIDASANNKVTLLYGAKDPVYNHARVLQEEINKKIQIGNGYVE